SIKDPKGEVITQKSETFAVKTSKKRRVELELPEDIEPGMYTFESFVTYTGREALATDTFRVEIKERRKVDWKLVTIAAMIILVVSVLLFKRIRSGEHDISHFRRGGAEVREPDRERFKRNLEEKGDVEPRSGRGKGTSLAILLLAISFSGLLMEQGTGITGMVIGGQVDTIKKDK
ncbi:MAG: hypothetical protein ABEJ72_09140, partial [Candidatus Aenigmatarchaeota archaeon]